MTQKEKKIEIMAPAGSYESLMGAIQGGADSVYFGVGMLNMRSASAANFTPDDLARIAATCREHGLKSYLTVNTVLYDDDLAAMRELLDRAKAEGVSAVIAADQAAIFYARRIGLEVHLSTQQNVSNIETLAFYAQFADVVVLARELDLMQIRAIHDQIVERDIRGPGGELVKIELFAHGALCMAISGKCYLSLHEAAMSANRGACRQICRRSYAVRDRETGAELAIENQYIMSPQDLCTIDFLDEVIGAGVQVLKIEGRARSAEYVKRVSECYRQAADAVADGTFTPEKAAVWKNGLSEVFNRGFWGGYYLGQRLGEWSRNYGSSATLRKVYIGKVTNYFSTLGVAEILPEATPLHSGDRLLILGATTGVQEFTADDLRVELRPVDVALQGVNCSLKTPAKVRRNDKVYKLVANGSD
jgi:putative protease